MTFPIHCGTRLSRVLVHPTTPKIGHTTSISSESDVESDASDERQFFGCFSYVYPWRNTHKLRLHFENRDTSEYGALSKDRMSIRKSELSAMFRHIQANHPDVETVRGGSWLYNIPAYLRLFPPDYIKTAKPVGYETSFWALWGQFVARKGSIRQPTAAQFLECLNKQKTVDGCLQCFPYQVLRPECSIETFYDFFDRPPTEVGGFRSC